MSEFDENKLSRTSNDWEMHPSMKCLFDSKIVLSENTIRQIFRLAWERKRKRAQADAEYYEGVAALLTH